MSHDPDAAAATRVFTPLETVVNSEPSTARPGPWPQPGERIAGYELIRTLGAGGMGQVFLARQLNPQREVAIKLIRQGLASPDILARFALEAQALARLRHEGIARIYTAGTVERPEGALPYLVMEYVEGRPLRSHAQPLGLRERVRLLVSICEAVEHAHQRGVIHRDLKPANILVTAEGQPKILDFGVARVSQGEDAGSHTSQLTVAGLIVGTPAYMSPEQTRTDRDEVDTRSDVYALGVLGYELLCGQLPYTLPADQHGIIQTIREQPPIPLGRQRPDCRGDLETIIGKALEKDRERRYPSAGAMAEDLLRYLESRAILARPPTLAYRFAKFARRNPALTAALGLALVLGLSGVAAVTAYAVREQNLRQAAEAQARRALASLDFVRTLLSHANPEQAGRIDVSVREALAHASGLVAQSYAEQPSLQIELRALLAELYLSQGDFVGAQGELAEARRLAADQLAAEDPLRLEVETLDAHALLLRGEVEAAARAMAALLPRVAAVFPPDALKVLELRSQYALARAELDETEGLENELLGLHAQLAMHPQRAAVRLRLDVETLLGTLARQRGDLDRVLELRRRVAEDSRRELGEETLATLVAIDNLAYALAERGELDAAAQLQLAHADAMAARVGPRHPNALRARQNLGALLLRTGDLDGSRRELLAVARELDAAALPAEHPLHGALAGNLATLAYFEGRLDEALKYSRQAAESLEYARGELHQETIQALVSYAVVLSDTGAIEEAGHWYRRALERVERRYGPAHPATLKTHSEYAAFLRDIGELDQAIARFAELMPRIEAVHGAQGQQTLVTLYQYSGALQRAGRYAEALPLGLRVVEAADRVLGELSPVALLAPLRHGRTLLGLGRIDEAGPWLEQSYQRLQQSGASPLWQSWAAESLAEVHQRRGDRAQAERWRRQASALAQGVETPR